MIRLLLWLMPTHWLTAALMARCRRYLIVLNDNADAVGDWKALYYISGDKLDEVHASLKNDIEKRYEIRDLEERFKL